MKRWRLWPAMAMTCGITAGAWVAVLPGAGELVAAAPKPAPKPVNPYAPKAAGGPAAGKPASPAGTPGNPAATSPATPAGTTPGAPGSTPVKVPTETDPAAGHSYHGEAFDAGPRRAARLMGNTGKFDFPVTTKSEEARAFFLQGVGQLHGFWYWEAERSFRQAAKIDPDMAMAYWGMAMANANNNKRARGFTAEAEKRKAPVTPREKKWIESATAYFAETKDLKAKATRFFAAMEDIIHDFDDDEARAFLAWAMWTNNFTVPIVSRQTVDANIADVLRRNPMHPGAHHYRIHLWDGNKPARAVLAAQQYGPSQPAVAHAWHMPGHIYTGLKDYPKAAVAQEMSCRVDHAYQMADGVMPYEIHNYAHNNQWCVTSMSHIGRVRDAITVAAGLIQVPRHPRQNKITDAGSCTRFGRERLLEVLVRWEMWEEILAADAAGLLEPLADMPDLEAKRLRALGAAGFGTGDWTVACSAIHVLEEMAAKDPKKAANLTKAAAELYGRMLLQQGRPVEAVAEFKRAGDVRAEVMAKAQVAAGDAAGAEKTIKTAADAATNQLSQALALAEVYAAIGKKVEAGTALTKAAALAGEADADLPAMVRCRKLAATMNVRFPAGPRAQADRSKYGPLSWSAVPAPEWHITDPATGKSCGTGESAGRATLVIFHLGPACTHCVEQLGKFGPMTKDFAAAGVDIVAIASDPGPATRTRPAPGTPAPPAVSTPFPLLTDADRKIFKTFGVYDDFEDLPVHGTFLIDAAGKVRWRDIGPDPFMDGTFLLGEAKRLLALRPTQTVLDCREPATGK